MMRPIRSRWLPLAVLALLLPLLASLSAAPAGAQVVVDYRLDSTWTDDPPMPEYQRLRWPVGHLPGGVAADVGASQVYVTDRTAGTLRIYAPDGSFEGLLLGPSQSGLGLLDPRDVAVYREPPASGDTAPGPTRLAVSDTGNDQILILDLDGREIERRPIPSPRGLVATERQLYAISGDGTMHAWEHAGTLIGQIPLNEAREPLQLAQDYDPDSPELLFVADAGLEYALSLLPGTDGFRPWRDGRAWPASGSSALMTIPAVDPRGEFHQYVFAGEPGQGISQLDSDARPGGVIPFQAVHDLGLYYDGQLAAVFAAVEPYGLVRFDDFNDILGYTGRSPQVFYGLHRVAVDGYVGVSEDSPRVQVLKHDGTTAGWLHLSRWPEPRIPARDIAAADDNVFVLTSSLGGVVAEIVEGLGQWRPSGQRLLTALSARGDGLRGVGRDGDVVAVLDTLAQEVVLLDRRMGQIGSIDVSTPQFRGLFDLDLSHDRLVLADQQAGVVEIWTRGGDQLSSTPIPGGLRSVAAGPDQDAFALAGSGWVYHLDAQGRIDGQWPVGSAVDRPMDIDVDDSRRLWVVDRETGLRSYLPTPPDPGGGHPPVEGDSPCHVVTHKSALPAAIELGETVRVTLRVDGECPIEEYPADVVLVIDRSGSMGGDKIAAARDAAIEFAARTDAGLTRVGVIEFDDQVAWRHPLGDPDRRTMIQGIARISPSGSTNILGAYELALETLEQEARPDARRVIVLLSDGHHNTGPDRSQLPAFIQRAAEAGVSTFTIGLGGGADWALLSALAVEEDRYFFTPSSFEIYGIYQRIARRVEATRLFAQATVEDVLPENMAYVEGSAQPVEPERSPDGRRLIWRLADVLEPGFELSYDVEPLEAGRHPTNVEAWTDFEDGLSHRGRAGFPVPEVTVVARHVVHLPLLLRQQCDPERQAVDVVLVMDASTSMRAEGGGGRTRQEAARAAASRFVDLVSAKDRVAVVSFNQEATIQIGLSADKPAVQNALAAIQLHQQTRIDLGIRAAREVLAGRRPEARPVIVLLTDGLANPMPVSAAEAEAELAADQDITIFTIGLGTELDFEALRRIASLPGGFKHATDGQALEAIYAEIAREVPCPGIRQAP